MGAVDFLLGAAEVGNGGIGARFRGEDATGNDGADPGTGGIRLERLALVLDLSGMIGDV